MKLLIGLFLIAVLLSGVQIANADHRWDDVQKRKDIRFSDYLDAYKKGQESIAIQYQKDVMSFDYAKIQNDNPGFKGPVETDVKDKKQIQRYVPSNLKY